MAEKSGNRRQFLFQLTMAGASAATVNSWAQQATQSIEPLTVENPLPVPGTNGLYGFDFCVQIVKLEIDFHPGNVFALPPELNPPLQPQRLALRLTVCAAIVCPDDRGLEDIVKDLETRDRDDQRKDDEDGPRLPPTQ